MMTVIDFEEAEKDIIQKYSRIFSWFCERVSINWIIDIYLFFNVI